MISAMQTEHDLARILIPTLDNNIMLPHTAYSPMKNMISLWAAAQNRTKTISTLCPN